MSTATIHASADVTLSYAVRVQRLGSTAAHRLIVFPGMAGAEVLEGEDSYESYRVSGWIAGEDMADLQANCDTFESQYRALRGRTADKLTVTNDDGSSYSVANILGESALSYGDPASYSTGYIRPVQFTVKRVR